MLPPHYPCIPLALQLNFKKSLKGRRGKPVAQGGGWAGGMGKESCPHCVKISLCTVWPTHCLKCCEHWNINRLPPKARFPGSSEKGEDSGFAFPQSTNQLELSAACPLRSFSSPVTTVPKGQPLNKSAWHLGIPGVLTPTIRLSAGCLAHMKLSGTGRPFLPPYTRC